ncbi:MAG: polysaccharide biosynthesis C-terminal domain-containing protein [Burkholderiales bacterium]|nr:polysaccharide biosynthesis C-terminal domain-containing protein [Burkholderiales bacterium]MDE1929665.1 polysaccharide biosynthesis C-terminal domain-containing protein [Burkholderiales bacterium]MDE2159361.1 polysaccharide biosynthesis C-terminal domain-containing protein [Burkholderiales bacterium]MDE2502652.1 polysaccharide biosynthesis C-terminal domain-containing protein [Burkholderiales bacterium]
MSAAASVDEGVRKGTLVNLVTRGARVAAVLGITTLVARVSPQAQGTFALFTSVEGLLLALVSGFGIALARRVSHHGEQPRGWVGAMVLALAGFGLLAGAVLWAVSAFGPAAYRWLWLLAVAAPLLLLSPNLAGWWLGQGRMVPMSRVSLAPPCLALALLAVVWALGRGGVPQVLAAWVGAKLLVALVLLGLFRRGDRLGRPDFAALRADTAFIVTIGVTNLIGLANYRVGLFVVEHVRGLADTGVYSIAVVVAELLWFVSGSLTQAVYARIGTPDADLAANTTVRVVQLGVTALLLAAPLLWLLAALLLPRVLGPAYAGSLLPLALLLPGALLFGGASAFSAYFTNHVGRPQVPAQVAALSLLVNGLLAWTLVPRLGTAGAALAASAAYTVSVVVLAGCFASAVGWPLRRVLWPGPALARDLRLVFARRRR